VRFPPYTLRAITMQRNRAFRSVVGGVQPRTRQEGEQPRPFVFEMTRQPVVRRIPAACFQHPIQLGFQLSHGDAQAALQDVALLITVAQLQLVSSKSSTARGKATAAEEAICAISRQRFSR
jgi:hypothetical protein